MSVIKKLFVSLFGNGDEKASDVKAVQEKNHEKNSNSGNKSAIVRQNRKAVVSAKKTPQKKSPAVKSIAVKSEDLKADFEKLKICLKANECKEAADVIKRIVNGTLKVLYYARYKKEINGQVNAPVKKLEKDKVLTKIQADNFMMLHAAIPTIAGSVEVPELTANKILSMTGNFIRLCEEMSQVKKVESEKKKAQMKTNIKVDEHLKNKLKTDYSEAKKHSNGNKKEKELGIKVYAGIFRECITALCKSHCPSACGKKEAEMIKCLENSGVVKSKRAKLLERLCEKLCGGESKPDVTVETLREIHSGIGNLISFTLESVSEKPKEVQKKKVKAEHSEKKSEKKAAIISFKKMKKQGIKKGDDVRKKFPELYEYWNKAKTGYNENDFKTCLHELRNALELIVKYLCRKCGVESDKALIDCIDDLEKYGGFSGGHVKILHSVRKLGNLGSHHGSNPQKSDAREAMTDFEKVKKLFEAIVNASSVSFNEPMQMSDYYSPARKYYGRWSRCRTYQEMALKNEYNELKTKADCGDIEAMLDLANGFLEENILWSPVSLICLRENSKYLDSFDVRYYYWVTKACMTAYNAWQNGKAVPLKYLPTALMEALKFSVYHDMHLLYTTNSEESAMTTQYTYSQNYLFGELNINKEYFADMLIALLKEFKSGDIISAVHRERTVEHVKFLMYLSYLGTTKSPGSSEHDSLHIFPERIPGKYAIKPSDAGKLAEDVILDYKGEAFDINLMHWDSIRKKYLERLNRKNDAPVRYVRRRKNY